MENYRKNLGITIEAPGGDNPLLVDLVMPYPYMYAGIALANSALVGKGGVAPYSFEIESGALPTGTSITGVPGATDPFTGTPSAVGRFTFIVKITDFASTVFRKAITVDVLPSIFEVATHPTPGERTIPYSYQVIFADAAGDRSGFTYSHVAGTLPNGVTCNSAGLLSGTPTVAATFNFTIRGTKSGVSRDIAMSCRIYTHLDNSSIIVALPSGLVNQALAGQISVADGHGVPPYTFEITSNALPDGISVDRLRGALTGKPSAMTPSTGWSNPVVTVTDRLGVTATKTLPFQVNQGVKALRKGYFPVGSDDDTAVDVDFMSGFFGGGSDGDLTISSGLTAINRDTYYNNLTVNGTGQLNLQGHRIFVANTLDITACPADGIISTSAYNIVAGTGGAGGTNNGTNGGAVSSPTYRAGGDGGTGGNGGHGLLSNTGGAGSTSGSPTTIRPRFIFSPMANLLPSVVFEYIYAGIGGGAGGGGAGNGTNPGGAGGNGGRGGGYVDICARTIARGASTAAGAINVNGAVGSAGIAGPGSGRGGGGGGAGGGAGFLRLFYLYLTGAAATNALRANGGAGGNGGNSGGGLAVTAGDGGDGGDSGAIFVFDMLNGTSAMNTGTAGAANSGQTGGAAGVCQVSL